MIHFFGDYSTDQEGCCQKNFYSSRRTETAIAAPVRARLEQELQSELNLTGRRTGRGNAAECGRLDVVIGQPELGAIEQVEEFGLELRGEPLDGEVFSDVEVDVEITGTDEVVPLFVAECVRGGDSELLWVEPLLPCL